MAIQSQGYFEIYGIGDDRTKDLICHIKFEEQPNLSNWNEEDKVKAKKILAEKDDCGVVMTQEEIKATVQRKWK